MKKFKIVQLANALDYGDAVSNQIIRLHQLLQADGMDSKIYVKYVNDKVKHYVDLIQVMQTDDDTIVLHHYCGYSEIERYISSCKGQKILVYHNITPHTFFNEKTSLYYFCIKGEKQFREIVSKYRVVLGDSEYNCSEAKKSGASFTEVLPIIVRPFDIPPAAESSAERLRRGFDRVWLFVGRIAPNKRQDLLVDIFSKYISIHPNETHHMYLVGRYGDDDPYYQSIISKIKDSGLSDRITFCGMVEDEDLPAYYKAADIFLCMSEHEGFCVPVIEAFNTQIPVLAYAETAVAETVGHGPGALNSQDIDKAIEKIHSIFTDGEQREAFIDYGNEQAARFTEESVRKTLYQILERVDDSDKCYPNLTVSIIICTYNRADYLLRLLNYLEDQDYPYFEVIVVNGPSDDDTTEVVSRFTNVKLFQNPSRNLSISRNIGIRHAAGEIIAFIDDDALPFNSWLSEIVKCYKRVSSRVVGLGGRTFYAGTLKFQFEDGVIDGFGTVKLLTSNDPKVDDASIYRIMLGTNCTFRRESLEKIGGFDEQYDYYHDEADVSVRLQKAGGLISHTPFAYLRHEFALSHNRAGKYKYNWFTIAKNSIYFGMKNGPEKVSFFKKAGATAKIVNNERIRSFIGAYIHREIGIWETLRHSSNAFFGGIRGCYDSLFKRKLGKDLNEKRTFLPFIKNITPERVYVEDKLHVLIISQEFPPHSFGGIGAYNFELTKELLQLGHSVTVISRGWKDNVQTAGPYVHIEIDSLDDSKYWPGLPTLSKNIAWAVKSASVAREVHRDHPIDIVESALWDFEGIGILALRPEFQAPLVLRLVTPLKLAIETNGWSINDDLAMCLKMEKEFVQQANAVIAISNSIKDTFSNMYGVFPDGRWSVQHLGIQPWPGFQCDFGYNEMPKSIKRGEIQILFVGRLESRKGIDVLLHALSIAMPENKGISVWIAGEDQGNWYEKSKSILMYDYGSRINFLGTISEETRELLYAHCDFVVFPSRYESFGLIALEAMVHGKPVIGARGGAIPELVIDGENGLLFDAEDYKHLSECILKLAGDEELRKCMAESAKARIKEFSSRKMAKRSLELYYSLLS